MQGTAVTLKQVQRDDETDDLEVFRQANQGRDNRTSTLRLLAKLKRA